MIRIKTIYIIGGAMGVGKTTVCQLMKRKLNNSVFLDGDWCWDAHPFLVTEETKSMVMRNICFLLNQFIHCSAYENIIFCWVMDEQNIIDQILSSIEAKNCTVKRVSLICSENYLRMRLMQDVASGRRTEDVVERSISRIPNYTSLQTEKVNTDGKSVEAIANEIITL